MDLKSISKFDLKSISKFLEWAQKKGYVVCQKVNLSTTGTDMDFFKAIGAHKEIHYFPVENIQEKFKIENFLTTRDVE